MTELKKFLNSAAGQHIRQVYLNDKKEWLFAPRPGYETKLSREQVLAYTEPSEETVAGVNKHLTKAAAAKDASSSNTPPKQKHSNRF